MRRWAEELAGSLVLERDADLTHDHVGQAQLLGGKRGLIPRRVSSGHQNAPAPAWAVHRQQRDAFGRLGSEEIDLGRGLGIVLRASSPDGKCAALQDLRHAWHRAQGEYRSRRRQVLDRLKRRGGLDAEALAVLVEYERQAEPCVEIFAHHARDLGQQEAALILAAHERPACQQLHEVVRQTFEIVRPVALVFQVAHVFEVGARALSQGGQQTHVLVEIGPRPQGLRGDHAGQPVAHAQWGAHRRANSLLSAVVARHIRQRAVQIIHAESLPLHQHVAQQPGLGGDGDRRAALAFVDHVDQARLIALVVVKRDDERVAGHEFARAFVQRLVDLLQIGRGGHTVGDLQQRLALLRNAAQDVREIEMLEHRPQVRGNRPRRLHLAHRKLPGGIGQQH